MKGIIPIRDPDLGSIGDDGGRRNSSVRIRQADNLLSVDCAPAGRISCDSDYLVPSGQAIVRAAAGRWCGFRPHRLDCMSGQNRLRVPDAATYVKFHHSGIHLATPTCIN
jgi:hypothetical protein